MICEKCGYPLTTLEVNVFAGDGSDYWTRVLVNEVPDNAVYIDMPTSWTGNDMSEEEQAESIRCPLCRKHPFKTVEIDTYDYVRAVMFKHQAERKEE